jgi:hypothetical protein
MQLKKFASVIAAVGLLGLAGAANAAVTLTLNPSAGNGDPSKKTIYAGQSAFGVNSIQTTLSSQLDISTNSGSASWQEAGALVFTTYNNATFAGGNRFYGGGNYDIYGLFSGQGGGLWTGNNFDVNSISSFVINIYASPSAGSAISVSTPTSGTQANGGVTAGSADFLLGTATFAGSFGGTSAQINGLGGATTQLTASFNFAPASASYVGLGGYFQAPIPFSITFNGSGSTNAGQSIYSIDGSGVHIQTLADGGATGNLRPLTTVPEPGVLSLAAVGLLGLGFASRRKGRSHT